MLLPHRITMIPYKFIIKMRIVKCLLICGLANLVCILPTSASVIIYSFDSAFANNGVIPDGDLNGWQDTRSINGLPEGYPLADVNVKLNLSGGWNGDIYGYLVHDTGFAVLLNRVGKTAGSQMGYDDPGFKVTFDDSPGGQDIHLYKNYFPSYNMSGQLSGIWSTDGRITHPSNTLDTDQRSATLYSFNLINPNGEWTLFLADVSIGSEAKLVDWELELTVVPEPVSILPMVFLLGSWLIFRARHHNHPGNGIA